MDTLFPYTTLFRSLDARDLPVLLVAVRERARREHEAQHREHVPDDDQLLEHAAPRPTCLRAGHRRSGYRAAPGRSEEHTSELQSLMRISYAVFCLKKKK